MVCAFDSGYDGVRACGVTATAGLVEGRSADAASIVPELPTVLGRLAILAFRGRRWGTGSSRP